MAENCMQIRCNEEWPRKGLVLVIQNNLIHLSQSLSLVKADMPIL